MSRGFREETASSLLYLLLHSSLLVLRPVSKLSQDAAFSALCNIEKDWNTLQEENIFNIRLLKNHENLKPIKRRKDQLYINQQLWECNKLHILLLLFNNALITIMMIIMIMLTAILCSDFHILSKMGEHISSFKEI